MPEDRDRRTVVAESPAQMRGQRIRTRAQLAVGQRLGAANVCDLLRRNDPPLIDSLEQIHSESLIDERRSREITAPVEQDQPRDNSEVINNQTRAPQPRMHFEPVHFSRRCSTSAMTLRGVFHISRSNSAGDTLIPNSDRKSIMSSTVFIESRTW